jgi:hypothetical protein
MCILLQTYDDFQTSAATRVPNLHALDEMMSALPSKADMCGAMAHVCYGPEPLEREFREIRPPLSSRMQEILRAHCSGLAVSRRCHHISAAREPGSSWNYDGQKDQATDHECNSKNVLRVLRCFSIPHDSLPDCGSCFWSRRAREFPL